MKKFLTMLLALSVVFTYTFGAAGSVFAATATYDSKDAYKAELNNVAYGAEGKVALLTSQAKVIAAGMTVQLDTSINYSKDAIVAARDAVVEKAKTKIDAAIEQAAYNYTGTAVDADAVVNAIVYSGTATIAKLIANEGDALNNAILAETSAMNKKEIEVLKQDITDALAKLDPNDYVADDESNAIAKIVLGDATTEVMSSAQAVAKIKESVADDVKDIDNGDFSEAGKTSDTDANKAKAYAYVLNTKDYALGTGAELMLAVEAAKTTDFVFTTKAAKEEADKNLAKTLEQQVAAYKSDALEKVYQAIGINAGNWTAVDGLVATGGDLKAFYTEKTNAKKATVLGVEIADITVVTAAEAKAVKEALYNAVIASVDVVKAYGEANGTLPVYATKANILTILSNSEKIVDVNEDIDELTASKKAEYNVGVKVYDDAVVDQIAVKAKKLAAAALGGDVDTAADYYAAAKTALNVEDKLVTTDLAKLNAVKADAIKKMFKTTDSTEIGNVTTSVKYGDNKTPAEDYVYLVETYANKAAYTDTINWHYYATKAVNKINKAESATAVEEIMAEAKANFETLLTDENNTDVTAARTTYLTAFADYCKSTFNALGATKYTYAFDRDADDDFTDGAIYLAGKELIDAAITVDAVKAAYAEAKALADNAKSDKEIEAAAKAVKTAIDGIAPSYKLSKADRADVEAVYKQYDEFLSIYGAVNTDVTNYLTLETALKTVYTDVTKDLQDKYDTLKKELTAVAGTSDADLAAYVAKKADAKALIEEIDAYADLMDAYKETATRDGFTGDDFIAKKVNQTGTTSADFEKDGSFYTKEMTIARNALIKAGKDGATVEEKKAALDAYNALSDLQKFTISADSSYASLIASAEKAVADAEEAAKWTDKDVKAAMYDAAKTTSYTKPSKTSVKLTAKANVAEIKENGYTVKYRFYQKGPKKTSYKLWKTTTSNNYTFKGLKKGTHYFKVKISVYDAEGKLVAYKYTNYRYLNIK